ncbi:LptF/LptG family permease [Brachyspira pilosicoli]|uniref:LptF/LptG family permease n=1 Tax=Brachyspira pilosicoli TaxID=52584 RepID=A0AAJ6G9Y2_BRAPL|nr:LptF/LptG family permease [Brachyspira pilosicoli]MBW5398503.1 YjgP/YjgQ family permease [Brachyspira pilosicoli]WIH84403.1 LptF/LptG family permease [Brachyspira pilosicoli]WIH86020.1 LptF/LptG family permease [Brachyspira pilosicoli]WIH88282.1 LptF/LptG family permease [Brachyspira pilosicoli]WIH90558.1 LptF/LptG family permease [Brachyspira pilosicoli]
MKKIKKYIILEAIGPFIAGVLFFTFIFVIQLLPELFKLILNNGAPIWTSLEIFVYMLPFNVAITIPMSILMAGIMGYGRLSSDNEIIVMRALGFSHMRIYAPIIILGFFTFLFSLFFNNVVMTESNYRYRALFSYIINIRPSIAVGKLEFAYISDINLSIGAYYSDNNGMSNVVIYDGNSQARRIITAKSGKWKNNEANSKVITLTLYDGIVQEMPVYGFVSNDFTVFDAMDINIVRNVSKLNDHERGLREIPAWEIRKKINTSMNDSLQTLTNQISNMISTAYSNSFITNIDGTTNIILTNANVSFSSFSNTYVTTNSAELDRLYKSTKKEAVPYFYYVEFHKFISIPAACLFMVFIGAPLGIVGKRSGRGFGFGLSVIVVVVYYILITVAEIIAGNRKVPGFVAMWFPNIVLAVIGGFLMIRSFFSKGK